MSMLSKKMQKQVTAIQMHFGKDCIARVTTSQRSRFDIEPPLDNELFALRNEGLEKRQEAS